MQLFLAGRALADDGNGPSGTLGLVVFLVLLAGCILLFRSMSGRIRRLPPSFGPPVAAADEPDLAGSPGSPRSPDEPSTT